MTGLWMWGMGNAPRSTSVKRLFTTYRPVLTITLVVKVCEIEGIVVSLYSEI